MPEVEAIEEVVCQPMDVKEGGFDSCCQSKLDAPFGCLWASSQVRDHDTWSVVDVDWRFFWTAVVRNGKVERLEFRLSCPLCLLFLLGSDPSSVLLLLLIVEFLLGELFADVFGDANSAGELFSVARLSRSGCGFACASLRQ